jgi:hypothetical protein
MGEPLKKKTSWGKHAGVETNTNYLLDLDFLDLVEE